MATELGELQWTISADNSDLKKKIDESTAKVSDFSKSIEASQKVTKAMIGGVAIAGTAVIGFGLASVQAYQESQDAVSQLEAAIKSTGDASGLSSKDFQDQAAALQRMTGVSDEAVISSEAMLSTFTNLKGGVMQKATNTVLDMATAMNGGLIPSAEQLRDQSIQLGKALNNPTEGLTALTRVGVTFTDQQKEQIKKMQEAGDIAGAQGVVLNELSKEFGGSAEAAGKTFSGQINIAKQTVNDFMELVGASIVKYMQPMIEKFIAWTNSIGGAQGMMDLLILKFQQIKVWMQDHIEIVIAVAGAIAGILVSSFVAWAAAAWTAAAGTIAALAPVIAIGAAVALVGYLIFKNWDWIKQQFRDAKEEIVYIGKSISDYLTSIYAAITDPFKKGFDFVVDYIKGIPGKVTGALDKIKGAISDALNPFQRHSPSLVDNVIKGIDTIKTQYASIDLGMPSMPVAQLGKMNTDVVQAAPQKQASTSEIHVHVGMFAGSAQELRKIAETITAEQNRIDLAKGMA